VRVLGLTGHRARVWFVQTSDTFSVELRSGNTGSLGICAFTLIARINFVCYDLELATLEKIGVL
jgi:hypothetical protein